MIRISIGVILLCLCLTITGRGQYFNLRSTFYSFQGQSRAICWTGNKYMILSQTIDSLNDNHNGTYYDVFDLNFSTRDVYGNLIHDTVYQRADRGDYEINSNLLIQNSNNEFLVPGTGFDTDGILKLRIGSFDSLGKLNWIRLYNKPICQGINNDHWGVTDFKKVGKNWLVFSTIKCNPTGNASYVLMMLTKLDSNFNIRWHKLYGDSIHNNYTGHLIIDSNKYLLSGCKANDNYVLKGYQYQTELISLDTDGNVLWKWFSSPSQLENVPRDIIKTKDGGYVYCGQGDGEDQLSQSHAFSTVYWYPTITKIDYLGNLLWHDKLSYTPVPESDYNEINSLKETGNGDILAAGQIIRGFDPGDTGVSYGVLVRLKNDGSYKFKRKFRYNRDTLIYHVYDFTQDLDGGYTLVGDTYNPYNGITSPGLQAWIIKVDSNGCSSTNDPQCWPVGVTTNFKSLSQYDIFPNPATTTLNLKYSHNENVTIFNVMDIYGREQIHEELLGEYGQKTFNIQNLSSGLYPYYISHSGRIIKYGKVIVH